MVAIDEAHCVVKWGSSNGKTQAFRESYFRLHELRSLLQSKVPFIVLTATALPEIRKQIIPNLRLSSILHITASPDRSDIRYATLNTKTDELNKLFLWLLVLLKEKDNRADWVIVFCQTHPHCRSLYRYLDTNLGKLYTNYLSRPYAMFHAATENVVKSPIIESMTKDDGTVRVLIATTAFGMGVDCKNLHLIVHFGPPTDIDDYVQESSRAGRDGQPSNAVLIRYPRCTSGRKLKNRMKFYLNNTNVCRPKVILKCFGCNVDSSVVKHNCCDICSTTCLCADDRCLLDKENLISQIEMSFQQKEVLPDEDLDKNVQMKEIFPDAYRRDLKRLLLNYHNQLTETCTKSVVSAEFTSDFPLCVVKEIVYNLERLQEKQSIWLHTSILNMDHVTDVHSKINQLNEEYHINAIGISQTSDLQKHNKNGKDENSSTESDEDNTDSTNSSDEDAEKCQQQRANFHLSSDSSYASDN